MFKKEIKKIISSYSILRNELSILEKETINLNKKQEVIHNQLLENRKNEENLINKIEKHLGRKITQQELFEMSKDE
jgi:hypothetical protein